MALSTIGTNSIADDAVTTAKTSGLGITVAQQWRLNADKTSLSGQQDITANLELADTDGSGSIGSNMTESSGIFSFPTTGKYLIEATAGFERTSGSVNYCGIQIKTTTNNSSYDVASQAYETLRDDAASNGHCTAKFIFNVTDTSTHKVKFTTDVSDSGLALKGNTSYTWTSFLFLRIGG